MVPEEASGISEEIDGEPVVPEVEEVDMKVGGNADGGDELQRQRWQCWQCLTLVNQVEKGENGTMVLIDGMAVSLPNLASVANLHVSLRETLPLLLLMVILLINFF